MRLLLIAVIVMPFAAMGEPSFAKARSVFLTGDVNLGFSEVERTRGGATVDSTANEIGASPFFGYFPIDGLAIQAGPLFQYANTDTDEEDTTLKIGGLAFGAAYYHPLTEGRHVLAFVGLAFAWLPVGTLNVVSATDAYEADVDGSIVSGNAGFAWAFGERRGVLVRLGAILSNQTLDLSFEQPWRSKIEESTIALSVVTGVGAFF